MERFIIQTNQIDLWLKQILEKVPRVIAPVSNGEKTEFRAINTPEDVANEALTTTSSIKAAAFPQTETLFTYQKEGNKTHLSQVSEDEYPQTVIWHARPCDAMGFAPLSGIFNWDYKDSLYNARFSKVTIVSFACSTCDEYCFCTSVGGGPGQTKGSDIQITLLNKDQALVEVLTEKGKALADLAGSLLCKVEDNVDKETALAKLPAKFSEEKVHKFLEKAFDNPIWKQQSARCLGCGACAFVCPTCACFDIQESPQGSHGQRLRCWDSCGFSLFTQHTSGYNPRPTQATRWRQRILHKFSYMPDRIGQYGCTGCGRCSRACPVDMNIQEHLIAIANSSHE